MDMYWREEDGGGGREIEIVSMVIMVNVNTEGNPCKFLCGRIGYTCLDDWK
jgi:hypothetical protein